MLLVDDLYYLPDVGYYSQFKWFHSPVFSLYFRDTKIKRNKNLIRSKYPGFGIQIWI